MDAGLSAYFVIPRLFLLLRIDIETFTTAALLNFQLLSVSMLKTIRPIEYNPMTEIIDSPWQINTYYMYCGTNDVVNEKVVIVQVCVIRHQPRKDAGYFTPLPLPRNQY